MLVRFLWMSVRREKVSKDKQGFIERVFDYFGRDLRRLQARNQGSQSGQISPCKTFRPTGKICWT